MKKTVVITGGNSGISKALVKACMQSGHNVVMIARDSAKTAQAYQEMKGLGGSLTVLTGDLSVPDDIRHIVSKLDAPIDILINNAGLLKRTKALSAEGVEMTMSVNYLAAYRLTMGLIQRGNAPKRVINITSELFRKGKVDVRDMADPAKYNGQQAYANAKLANLMFSYALEQAYAGDIGVIALHPGVVATSAFREYPKWVAGLLNCFLEKPESAAQKIAEIALADRAEAGYYNQNKRMGPVAQFVDPKKAEALAAFSKQYL